MVIVVITGFQVYWLRDNYKREQKAIAIRTDALFHETVRQVQDSLLQEKWNMIILKQDSTAILGIRNKGVIRPIKAPLPAHPARILSRLSQRMPADSTVKKNKSESVYVSVRRNSPYGLKDTTGKMHFVFDSLRPDDISEVVVVKTTGKNHGIDSLPLRRPGNGESYRISETTSKSNNHNTVTEINTLFFNNEKGDRFKIKIDSLINDSIPLHVLETTFKKALRDENLDLPFTILRQKKERHKEGENEFIRRPFFGNINGYKLELGNTFSYLLKQISLPILFSVFLVGLTALAFMLLYRSLLKQHRLAQIKNDLISNITHELKTPIATVGVAIEALRNFNAIQDPQRTREYLDISQNELQRLGLLVDKVLKLSMFEKKEIELKYELFDLKDVVDEVVTSLRLQIEKNNARVTVDTEGDTSLKADRLHLLSVVFNLLDNALKYSKDNPAIQVFLKEEAGNVVMTVKDNGIGIPAAYREKIFEKFFRVPTGDTHDAKGHGLGLSYAAQVLRQHNGSITVESHEGIGSTFTITIPKDPITNGNNKLS